MLATAKGVAATSQTFLQTSGTAPQKNFQTDSQNASQTARTAAQSTLQTASGAVTSESAAAGTLTLTNATVRVVQENPQSKKLPATSLAGAGSGELAVQWRIPAPIPETTTPIPAIVQQPSLPSSAMAAVQLQPSDVTSSSVQGMLQTSASEFVGPSTPSSFSRLQTVGGPVSYGRASDAPVPDAPVSDAPVSDRPATAVRTVPVPTADVAVPTAVGPTADNPSSAVSSAPFPVPSSFPVAEAAAPAMRAGLQRKLF